MRSDQLLTTVAAFYALALGLALFAIVMDQERRLERVERACRPRLAWKREEAPGGLPGASVADPDLAG